MSRLMVCALAAFVAVTPVVATDLPNSAADQSPVAPGDKIRCKRYVETGSLAKVRKECHTVAQWERLAADGSQEAREMIKGISGLRRIEFE